MKTVYILLFIMSVSLISSCGDWLDIMPKEKVDQKELYSTEKGFENSLVGCYIKLRDVYVPNLTITYIEYMAQHWMPNTRVDNTIEENLKHFDYEDDAVEDFIDKTFEDMFNVIAQANEIIEHTETNKDVFSDESLRMLIKGEALAIRAFCHFDLLRLFGQLPVNATIKVELPYKFIASVDNAAYFSFEQYIGNVIADYSEALELLEMSDLSVGEYSFTELNAPQSLINDGTIQSDFVAFRKSRFNYWGVKALLARAYLYNNDKANAYSTAMEIINAKVSGGNSTSKGEYIVDFNGNGDFNSQNYTLPTETLISINSTNMAEVVDPLFFRAEFLYNFETKQDIQLSLYDRYTVPNTNINDIDNPYITSHNRYNKLWIMNSVQGATPAMTVNKYENNNLSIKNKQVPIIRLSEVYLIAIESASDINEANALFVTYMSDRDIAISIAPMTDDELRLEILDEYQREFYAEGQMWFTYKRFGALNMRWRNESIVEENYILPIPETEYK